MTEKINDTNNVKRKTILYVGGGTAGHIFPAQVLAERSIDTGENYSHVLLTDYRGERFADKNVFNDVHPIDIYPDKILTRAFGGLRKSYEVVKQYNPSVVYVFGGYVSGYPAIAAKMLGIPIRLIETNALMGRANRFIQWIADKVFVSFENTKHANKKAEHIGFLVRKSVLQWKYINAGKGTDISKDRDEFKLLVMGSSIGTHILSVLLPKLLERLPDEMLKKLHIIQQTPLKDQQDLSETYKDLGVKAELMEYIQDVGKEMHEADLVICRAGASTIAEVVELGKNVILIPNSRVKDNHQNLNALEAKKILEAKGIKCCIVDEREKDEKKLVDSMLELFIDL